MIDPTNKTWSIYSLCRRWGLFSTQLNELALSDTDNNAHFLIPPAGPRKVDSVPLNRSEAAPCTVHWLLP